MIGILGGVFDPPHLGHVELGRAAIERFGLERLVVLVVAEPGHKPVDVPAEVRLRLARAAFVDLRRTEVRLDDHAYTVDFLRDEQPEDAIFLIGADEYAALDTWKEPDEVVRLVRLGVATRHGLPVPEVRPEHEGRVEAFEIDSPLISASEIRARAARGEPVDDLVPAAVAEEIARLGLYAVPRLH